MEFIKIVKNTNKKWKILFVYDVTIVDMLPNKKVNPTVTELFIRSRKRNIFLVFIKQYYFVVLKNIKLNTTNYFIMKIPNKWDSTNWLSRLYKK